MTRKMNILSKVILFWFSAHSVVGFRYLETCPAIEREAWSYEGHSNGPWQWGKTYPMCNGDAQSPIDIQTHDTKTDSSLVKLSLVNYNVPIARAKVLNNGYTVEITPRDNVTRYIVIDGTKFYLQQFHFHWSKQRNDGTEHALNRQRFSMEGHFVHTSDRNETAVVGVLYKAVSGENKAFKPIVDVLPRVRYQNDETVLKAQWPVTLNGLLPSNPSSFYRYSGSLTTPPCTEGVTWSVLKKVFHVGKEQLSQFFKLYAVPKDQARPGCKISTNVRPLQRLNKRVIVSSK